MIRHVVVLAALLTGLAGCPSKASCPKGTTATAAGADADTQVTDVLRAVEAWRQANEARSTEALLALYDHGKSVTVVTQGDALVGWDAVQAALTDRLARAKDIHLRLSDIKVAPTGDAAVATGALAREISDGVTSVADAGTLTLVFGRDGDKWVIIAEHFSFRR